MLENFDPQSVKAGFDLLKGAIDTLKSLRDTFKHKGETSDEIDRQITLAERQIALGEAQLAQALGYKLCRAHFPPIPMLKDRVHPKYIEDVHKCPTCGVEEPSLEHFAHKDRQAEMIRQHHATRSERVAALARRMP